jgi:hypothetical protein
MSQEQVAQIIFKEVKKAGYVVEQHRSISTNSVYYTIYGGKESLHIRVSDHATDKNVITLRLDRKNSVKTVESFIKNRIRDLGYRQLKMSLGL